MDENKGIAMMGHRGREAWRKVAFTPLILVALGPGCVPGLATDVPPEMMVFDPQGSPPLVPTPSFLAMNPTTGKIDLSSAGIDVPADCQAQKAIPIAQCEFFQYLESLDGFPTLTPAQAPASAALDMGTVKVPDNLFVYNAATSQALTTDALRVEVRPTDSAHSLSIDPKKGWDRGGMYFISVRGYEKGIRAQSGLDVVSSPIYFLLKKDESLACNTEPPALVSPKQCPYYQVIAKPGKTQEEVSASLFSLEKLRRTLRSLGPARIDAWNLIGTAGKMAKEEVAIFWVFPTHSSPVAEVDPSRGLVPEIVDDQTLRIAVKGTVKGDTVSRLVPLVGKSGTVLLLDLTELKEATSDLGRLGAFLMIDPSYESGSITVKLSASSLTPGHQYAIFLTHGITDDAERPLVPSPLTVLLRSRGPLVEDGKSTVSGVAYDQALQIEGGRKELAQLLDNESFVSSTGLSRDKIAYIYAFQHGGGN
ncbi:MAG: hypothetical protein HY698_05015 [Deltaproteobacteria bacterium]|nr:hypothetical protein [Deltaproteobacteria bacterium]